MEETLYIQLKKNWQFVHPTTKVLVEFDYFLEWSIQKIGEFFVWIFHRKSHNRSLL